MYNGGQAGLTFWYLAPYHIICIHAHINFVMSRAPNINIFRDPRCMLHSFPSSYDYHDENKNTFAQGDEAKKLLEKVRAICAGIAEY